MSGLDEASATYGPRIYNQEILPDILSALQGKFGVRIQSKANVLRSLAESGIAAVIDDHEQDLAALTSIALDPFSADVEALKGHTFPISEPRTGEPSAGVVELDYQAPFDAPSPWLLRTDLTLVDVNDNEHQPDADIPAPAKLHDNTGTGTASESISTGGTSRIAQRIVLTSEEYVQGVRFRVTGTPTVTLRVLGESLTATEPDPSNVILVDETGITPTSGVDYYLGFTSGAYTDKEGEAVWVEIEATTGSFTADGSNTGTTGDVVLWNGSNYAASSLVNALNLALYAGGVVPTTALFIGSAGNIDANSIADATLATTTAQIDWDANVGTGRFNNARAFTGGENAETAAQARNRIRFQRAARYGGSPSGLELAVEAVPGVIQARVLENKANTATAIETPYDGSADTGTASSTIDGTTPFIAARVTVAYRSFVQRIALTLASDTGFTGTVRLETDSNGDPGGLVATGTATTSYTPGGTSRVVVILDEGTFLLPDTTYHVSIQRTAGSATFDGALAATILTNGDFETYTTSPGAPDSWTDASGGSATLEKETTIINGGLNAVKITAGATPSANEGIKQTLTTTANRYYRVAAWARTAGTAGEQARLLIRNTTDALDTVTADGTDATTSYEELEVTFKAAAGKTYEIQLIHAPTATTADIVYFDDAITVTSSVSTSTDGVTWTADTGIDDLNTELIGGIPDRGAMVVVRGGDSDAIADAIARNRAFGPLAGDSSGTTTINEVTYTEWHKDAVSAPLVVDVAVKTTAAYPGGDAPIRDAIIRYLGGKDSDNETHRGPGINGTAVGTEAAGRLTDDDELPGVFSVTKFRFGLKTAFPTPNDLTASESALSETEYNLTSGSFEFFEVADPATDIRVVRVAV